MSSTTTFVDQLKVAASTMSVVEARPVACTPSTTVAGDELLSRAAGYARWSESVAVPGNPLPLLAGYSANTLAFMIGASTTPSPAAPLGIRLPPTELAQLVTSTGSPVLMYESGFRELASEVADICGVAALDLADRPAEGEPADLTASPEATALIIHTSGTTGLPKPVGYRHDVLGSRAHLMRDLLSLSPDSVFAPASPVHHIGGIGSTLVTLQSGGTVLCAGAFGTQWWQCAARLGTTHTLLVPSMIEMLLDAGVLSAPDLRTVVYGASPIRIETLRAAMAALPDVEFVNLFGQTEGSPICALTADDHRLALRDRPELLASVGRPVPGASIRLTDPDELGHGELAVAAPHLAHVDDDGWLRTGDIARIDADGYVHLVGRTHDRIIRGGENVYPVEVEGVIATHPAIREVAVKGVPDHRLGETVAAFVVPVEPGTAIDPDELRTFARDRLAGFKVPTMWVQLDELPRSAAGKVLRRLMTAPHTASSDGSPR